MGRRPGTSGNPPKAPGRAARSGNPGGEARSPQVSPDLRRSEPGAARSATRVHLLPREASQVTPRAPSGAPCPVWKDWSAFRRCSDCFRGGCNALRRGQQVMQKPSGQGPVCNTLQLPQLVYSAPNAVTRRIRAILCIAWSTGRENTLERPGCVRSPFNCIAAMGVSVVPTSIPMAHQKRRMCV